MTTCCEYGKCTNAPNCPVRQAHREAANRAYIERGRVVDTNPYADTFGTVKALISVLVVCVAVTLISFFIWGK
jgi:hypothetical protein